MATITHPPTKVPGCPSTFEAETYTKVSESSYERAVVDANGQHPTLAEQLDSQGVALLAAQRELLLAQPNPAWSPTYERVLADDTGPVEHTVAVCPNCGTPIKVG